MGPEEDREDFPFLVGEGLPGAGGDQGRVERVRARPPIGARDGGAAAAAGRGEARKIGEWVV
jgi:hypothetical protein